MDKTNYFGLMTIEWGLDFYNSKAQVYTKNRVLQFLCRVYLKAIGFRKVKASQRKGIG